MKRFEIVNGDEFDEAQRIVKDALSARGRVSADVIARAARGPLVERFVEPIVTRGGLRPVHLAAVALDGETLNFPHVKAQEGSEPVVLDLTTRSSDRFQHLRPRPAEKLKIFDRIRRGMK